MFSNQFIYLIFVFFKRTTTTTVYVYCCCAVNLNHIHATNDSLFILFVLFCLFLFRYHLCVCIVYVCVYAMHNAYYIHIVTHTYTHALVLSEKKNSKCSPYIAVSPFDMNINDSYQAVEWNQSRAVTRMKRMVSRITPSKRERNEIIFDRLPFCTCVWVYVCLRLPMLVCCRK